MQTNLGNPPSVNGCRGRLVAFLGDSMTDAAHIGCTFNYWNCLERDLGIVPLVYGVNGAQWCDLEAQAERLVAEHPGGVHAVFLFAGTNDFNSNVPPGEWFEVADAAADRGRGPVPVRRRSPVFDKATLRGRVNRVMRILREGQPEARVFLMTPIHRGYAVFGPGNVQPDESYSNELGLFIDDYVRALREASDVWAVPLIDLFAESGLYPLAASHGRFFADGTRDRLHPNDVGHERIAEAIRRHLATCGQAKD